MATVTAGNAERWGRPGKHVGLLVRKKEEADGCCFIFIREFEKNQYPLIKKFFSELGIERNFLNLLKNIYKKTYS